MELFESWYRYIGINNAASKLLRISSHDFSNWIMYNQIKAFFEILERPRETAELN